MQKLLIQQENQSKCFGERIISRYDNGDWSSRSPDLTRLDFLLWVYLKERVYINKQETLEQLKENIIKEIREVGSEAFKDVIVQALE